jgi:hypothetical protein
MDELLPEHRVIEQVAVGPLNDPAVLNLILGVQDMQKALDIGLTLLDCRDLTQEAGTSDVIALVDLVASRGLEPHWRQAILRPHDPFAGVTVDLWEAAANNRGVKVKSFRDRDAALAWLFAVEDAAPNAESS